MIKYKLLAFIGLTVLSMSCGGDKNENNNLFSIDTSTLKQAYNPSESIDLSLKNDKNKTIDSVIYYINDKNIGKTVKNDKFPFSLENQKLGFTKVKALVYFENEYAEVTHRIELISKIEPKLLSYTLINSYPHDSKAYTQGLEFHRDTLYEGTGNGAGNATGVKGISSLRKTNFTTGEVYKKIEYPEIIFGEGISILNNKVYQLTWQNGFGFIYDADNFTEIKRFNYSKRIQGWGLCNDGKMLYQSDGTEKIYMLNPETMLIESNINVYSGANKIKSVNELEWINGKIYGNIHLLYKVA